MDHSNGPQHLSELLPSVIDLEKGVTLLIQHPNVDRRYVTEHIASLDRMFRDRGQSAAFTELDLSRGGFTAAAESLVKKIESYKKTEVYQGYDYVFIVTPYFAPRMPALIAYVDHAFHYRPGIEDGALLIASKVNGASPSASNSTFSQTSPLQALLLHRSNRKDTQFDNADPEDGISIVVRGHNHSGRSVVSAIIHNALRDQWPQIPLNWSDPDNMQLIVQSNLAEGRYGTIDAKSFQITNETKRKVVTIKLPESVPAENAPSLVEWIIQTQKSITEISIYKTSLAQALEAYFPPDLNIPPDIVAELKQMLVNSFVSKAEALSTALGDKAHE